MVCGIGEREKRNLVLFIISYVLNNLVSGVLYDTYVNYLQEVSLGIATSFWAFYGYATFISAFLLLFVHRIGYKIPLAFCSLACAGALLCVVFFQSENLLFIMTLLALTGVQLHYIMLAPYVAAYTQKAGSGDIDWYTRTYYMGYAGYFLATYLGGVLTVKAFSLHSGRSYEEAKELTAYIADAAADMRAAYLKGNEDILLLSGLLSLICIIPVALIKQQKSDYARAASAEKKALSERARDIADALFRKDAMLYLLYWALISFAMGLFTSYYTVFLNRNLHIDKATSSLLVSISYAAIIFFMLFTPKAVKKFGTVNTICASMILSIPFMLLIAEGDRFGKFTVPVVGAALFIRAGLANLGSPADSALCMYIAPGHLRPAYASIVNFLAGIVSIASGNFTGKILFAEQEGYRRAYYIAALLYAAATLVVFIGLRKYNKVQETEEAENEAI